MSVRFGRPECGCANDAQQGRRPSVVRATAPDSANGTAASGHDLKASAQDGPLNICENARDDGGRSKPQPISARERSTIGRRSAVAAHFNCRDLSHWHESFRLTTRCCVRDSGVAVSCYTLVVLWVIAPENES
jgi:hypothetical protein